MMKNFKNKDNDFIVNSVELFLGFLTMFRALTKVSETEREGGREGGKGDGQGEDCMVEE